MLKTVMEFIRDEEGATAVEYGLIAALIAVIILSALTGIGTRLKAVFESILTSLGGTPA